MNIKKLKEKASEYTSKVITYSSGKLASSSITISDKNTLEKFIEKSENKKFKNKEIGEEKTFKKRVIVIFGEEKSDFFKKALYMLPSLLSKSFIQNVSLKLAKSNSEDIKLSDYSVREVPALVVFENQKVFKVISGKENILKLVKSFNLDINEEIDKF